jgi:hypothetical protein
MSNCQHAPLSGAALMAICGDCGAAYDVAPPSYGRPRRAQRSKRRQVTDIINMTASVFDRPSVMTPLAKPRAPRESPEKACRAEYDRYILALFDRAQLECNEFLSNEARAAGCKYSAWELFTHRKTVIAKWASEELITFFCFNRRLAYPQFREQWRDGQGMNQEREVA